MSSLLNFIKNLPEAASDDIVTDINYIRKSSILVNEALQKGSDIMQMPNGDIHITETKTVTYRYNWNPVKSRFERATSGIRARRRKKLQEEQNTTHHNENETEKVVPTRKIA